MQKYCFNTYITVPFIYNNTCGFADYLRGCCALLNFCKIYNYKLLINYKSHNLFKFFDYNPTIMADPKLDLIEIRSPEPYEVIDRKLDDLFKSDKSFNVFTNALYKNNILIDELDNDIKTYIQKLLTPNRFLSDHFNKILGQIGLDIYKPYITIHFRVGDCIVNTKLSTNTLIKLVIKSVKDIIDLNKDKQILFLSNSKIMREQVKELIPEILYSITDPIHLGVNDTDEKVADTLIDLLLLTKCIKIYSLGYSGFSYIVSKIYDIDYKMIKLTGVTEFSYNEEFKYAYNYLSETSLINSLRRKNNIKLL